jgi:hypothetical protein
MIRRVYAASYAVYFWSYWPFLLAIIALFVIPFTSLEARFETWCDALAIALASLMASVLSEALCRALLRWRGAKRGFSDEEARRIEFLEQERCGLHLAREASQLAAERSRQNVEAWWINNRRI